MSNQRERVLVSVHACGEVSQAGRNSAFDTLKNRTAVPKTMADDLSEDMMALEYKWTPDPSWKVPVDRIWGWISSQFPGRRYMKVLTRLALAQAECEQISKHIKTIWLSA